MFCKKCGNDIKTDGKFCIKCGAIIERGATEIQQSEPSRNEKWWHRLLRVLYIIAYLPLLVIIPLVWSTNKPYSYTSYYSGTTTSYGSYGAAFWYSLLTLVIYLAVLRLIKIAVLYVAFGQRPKWKKEFKKFF